MTRTHEAAQEWRPSCPVQAEKTPLYRARRVCTIAQIGAGTRHAVRHTGLYAVCDALGAAGKAQGGWCWPCQSPEITPAGRLERIMVARNDAGLGCKGGRFLGLEILHQTTLEPENGLDSGSVLPETARTSPDPILVRARRAKRPVIMSRPLCFVLFLDQSSSARL